MPRNGSGTYTRSNSTYTGSTVWQQDFAAGNKIVDSRHDLHDQDLADAITASLSKDGQTTPTANLPMGAFKHTNVAVASARTDYARASQVQDSTLQWCGTSGGSANAQTLTPSPAITAYVAGQRFAFVAGFTTTNATTINISGLGTRNIIKSTGTTLAQSDIVASGLYEIIYGGSDFVLLNRNETVVSTVAAAGANQAAATAITGRINYISSGTVNQGVRLPTPIPIGSTFIFENASGVTLNIYPASGHNISTKAVDDAAPITANQMVILVGMTSTHWAGI